MNNEKKREADDESNDHFGLDDQLQKLEQELRLAKPACPTASPDAMLKKALSAVQADRSAEADSSLDVSTTPPQLMSNSKAFKNNLQWIAAIACSWLFGAVAGALAMWAGSSKDNTASSGIDLAGNALKSQLIEDNQSDSPAPQNVRLTNLTHSRPSESRYRQFDIENLMGSTHLTVFSSKHRTGSTDGPFEPVGSSGVDLNSSMASPLENGSSKDSASDSPDAPTTRINLMKSLVF